MGLQFKRELADKIMKGQKTQTRRPCKTGEVMRRVPTGGISLNTVFTATGKVKWQEGRTYSIQPGRGKKGVGQFEVTELRYQDVREISLEDAVSEGFETVMDFIAVWVNFYDEQVHLTKLSGNRWELYISHPPARKVQGSVSIDIKGFSVEVTAQADQILSLIKQHRPDALYKAWVIKFVLLTPVAVHS